MHDDYLTTNQHSSSDDGLNTLFSTFSALFYTKDLFIPFALSPFHFRQSFIPLLSNVCLLVTHPSSGTECRMVRHSFSTCSTFRSSSGKSPSSCIRAESPLLNCDIKNSSKSKGSTASYDWGWRIENRWWWKGSIRVDGEEEIKVSITIHSIKYLNILIY